jgi:hypothetical protein
MYNFEPLALPTGSTLPISVNSQDWLRKRAEELTAAYSTGDLYPPDEGVWAETYAYMPPSMETIPSIEDGEVNGVVGTPARRGIVPPIPEPSLN